MSQITRLYGSHQDATSAAEELKAYRYQRVYVISPPHAAVGSEPAPTEHDHLKTIEKALHKAGIGHKEAAIYAPKIHGGATVVTVIAEFGEGSLAESILDAYDPVDSGVASSNAYSPTYTAIGDDDPAPLSRALGWKLLIDDPAPLSRFFGLPVLSSKQNSSTALSNNPAPLSSTVGLPTLSGKAAPLSGAFGIPTLSGNPAPLSKATGLKTLSNEPAPLSQKLGWKTLSSEPAPLSKLLGLPVLTEKQ
jgi:hypothetical protein